MSKPPPPAAATATATNGSSGGGGGRTGGVDSAMDRMIRLSSFVDDRVSEQFIPSPSWNGPRHGYYFGTLDGKTGYHLDAVAAATRMKGDGATTAGGKRVVQFSAGVKGSKKHDDDDDGAENDSSSAVAARRPLVSSSSSYGPARKRPKTGEELLAEAESELKRRAEEEAMVAGAGVGGRRVLDLSRGASSVRSAASALERAISANRTARDRHPDEPEKFMESEVALYDEVESLRDAAAEPDVAYPALVEAGAVDGLLGLLGHENADVAATSLGVLVEWLDPALLATTATAGGDGDGGGERSSNGGAGGIGILARAVVDGGGLDLAVANLTRLNENVDEEAKAMDDILTLAENLLDMDLVGALQGGGSGNDGPTLQTKSAAEAMLKDTSLLSWLLIRISKKETPSGNGGVGFPATKLHASEILSTLLQRDEARVHASSISSLDVPTAAVLDELQSKVLSKTKADKKDTRVDGMECLLQAIAAYRKRDPQSAEECEFLENCMDALSASLLSRGNVRAFLDAEGVELMLRCMRERVHSGSGALRALSFALSGLSSSSSSSSSSSASAQTATEGDDASVVDDPYVRSCETFVEAGGLKLLFPIYMGKSASIPKPAKCSDAGKEIPLIAPTSSTESNDVKAKMLKRSRKIKSARKEWLRNLEADALRVIYALTWQLSESSPHDAHERLVAKFLERDSEKIDRSIDLLLRYDAQARRAEYRYHASEEAEAAEEEGVDTDLAALGAKLRGGGELCHRVAAVIGFACRWSKRCHEHVLGQLKAKNTGVGVIKSALEEFLSLLEEGQQKDNLRLYLSTI